MSTIDRLRELEAAATPGPWRWEWDSGSLMLGSGEAVWGEGHVLTPHICRACLDRGDPCVGGSSEDHALIAEARNALPALLDIAEAARAAHRYFAFMPTTTVEREMERALGAALARLEAP